MQSPESQQIIERFFLALSTLIERKVLRGKQTFTRMYDINRWNLNTIEKNKASDMFQMAWLSYLINDFDVSAEWLMTGTGEMFKRKK